MEGSARVIQLNPKPEKIHLSDKSWSPALWLYIILLIVAIIAIWFFAIRSNKLLPYYPSGFPNPIVRAGMNTLIIIALVTVATLATHEKAELLPLFLILLLLTITAIIMVEISLSNGTILGQVAMFSAVAFLISLGFWSCIFPSRVNTSNNTCNYTYTAVLELPAWQTWLIYGMLFLVNVWLAYLTYQTTLLWVASKNE